MLFPIDALAHRLSVVIIDGGSIQIGDLLTRMRLLGTNVADCLLAERPVRDWRRLGSACARSSRFSLFIIVDITFAHDSTTLLIVLAATQF